MSVKSKYVEIKTIHIFAIHKLLHYQFKSEFTIKKKVLLKQDRQCTYDVTMRRVRAAIVAVEK